MGCSSSQHTDSANSCGVHKNFKVTVLDCKGQDAGTGHLEITHQDLVLYQRGKDSISWPLWSLRRYGYDKDLFSFECGRRCPIGPGIFAFRCNQAEALFSLLQVSILWADHLRLRDNRLSSVSAMGPSSEVELFNHLNGVLAANGTSDTLNKIHSYINDSTKVTYCNTAPRLLNYQHMLKDIDLNLPSSEVESGKNLCQSENQFPVKEEITQNTVTAKFPMYVNVRSGRSTSNYVNMPPNGEKTNAYINFPGIAGRQTQSNLRLTYETSATRSHTTPWLEQSSHGLSLKNSDGFGIVTNIGQRMEYITCKSAANANQKHVKKFQQSMTLMSPLCAKQELPHLSGDTDTFCDSAHGKYDDNSITLAQGCSGEGADSCKSQQHSCDVKVMYYC